MGLEIHPLFFISINRSPTTGKAHRWGDFPYHKRHASPYFSFVLSYKSLEYVLAYNLSIKVRYLSLSSDTLFDILTEVLTKDAKIVRVVKDDL
ncbi:hypothetical protein ACOSP7_009734 [Xanthoceras sorbifolium]